MLVPAIVRATHGEDLDTGSKSLLVRLGGRTEIGRLQPMGHIWPAACFCTAHELSMIFYVVKIVFIKRIFCDMGHSVQCRFERL